jgi:hypothetical protein
VAYGRSRPDEREPLTSIRALGGLTGSSSVVIRPFTPASPKVILLAKSFPRWPVPYIPGFQRPAKHESGVFLTSPAVSKVTMTHKILTRFGTHPLDQNSGPSVERTFAIVGCIYLNSLPEKGGAGIRSKRVGKRGLHSGATQSPCRNASPSEAAENHLKDPAVLAGLKELGLPLVLLDSLSREAVVFSNRDGDVEGIRIVIPETSPQTRGPREQIFVELASYARAMLPQRGQCRPPGCKCRSSHIRDRLSSRSSVMGKSIMP